MNIIDYHKTLFHGISSHDSVTIDASFIQIENPIETIIESLQAIGVEVENLAGGIIRLKTSSIDTVVFETEEQFRKIRKIELDSNILIPTKPPVSYFDSNTYVDFKVSNKEFLVTNAIAYLDFQDFLKAQEKESDDYFHFVDSYNKDFRKLSFVSLSDKGRLTIKYGLLIPSFDRRKDYSKGLEKFKSCFDEKSNNLPKFLKSALINTASSYPAESRFQQLFESLEDIVTKAKMNFEVYLNNLSIDKIKKDYNDLKSKYFEDLSEILSKLTNKIIGLPLAISATLLAIDKIDDVPFFLQFILATLLFTSIYLSLLLKIHFRDLRYVEKLFIAEYNTLIENKFFIKYPDESILFEEVKNRILKRIRLLKIIVKSYFYIFNFSNIVIVGYIINKLGASTDETLLVLILLLILIIVIRNNLFERGGIKIAVHNTA